MKKRRKKQRYEFADDGRVIANMNVDGMPRSFIRRTAFDEFGKTKVEKDIISLSRKEHWRLLLGAVLSHVVFALVVFGSFALFILFCTKVWFK